jgi:hypothetical protein
VSFKASELIVASFAAPPLPAGDDAEPDQAATAAPGTAGKIGVIKALSAESLQLI